MSFVKDTRESEKVGTVGEVAARQQLKSSLLCDTAGLRLLDLDMCVCAPIGFRQMGQLCRCLCHSSMQENTHPTDEATV